MLLERTFLKKAKHVSGKDDARLIAKILIFDIEFIHK
tara:strand:- start:62 stop:172 length:111 start_codon:yes stop_codon:yes gene_type:complete